MAGVQKELIAHKNSKPNQARRVESARAQQSGTRSKHKETCRESRNHEAKKGFFLHEHELDILPSLFPNYQTDDGDDDYDNNYFGKRVRCMN